MSNKELVSVVIPAYNAENFIEDAVKSCFRQIYRPVEVIMIDDGSTDSTAEKANGLPSLIRDSKLDFRVISIDENRGAANALDVGFSSANGDYICWLSADDMFIDKEKIGKQVDCMNKTGALWSYFRDYYKGTALSNAFLIRGEYLPSSKLRIFDPLFFHDSDLRLTMLLFKNPINGSSIMIERNCLKTYGHFDPMTRNVDADGDLWMRYSALKLKLVALNGAPVFYREHPAQTSMKRNLMMQGCELTRMRMLLTLEKTGNLVKLIKRSAVFFPLILRAKLHLDMPFVSEFIFNYVLDHKSEFNRVFVKYIRRSLNEVKNHANYRALDKNEFLKDLTLFMESYTFKKFEEIFLK